VLWVVGVFGDEAVGSCQRRGGAGAVWKPDTNGIVGRAKALHLD